jgi:hypothetical protein
MRRFILFMALCALGTAWGGLLGHAQQALPSGAPVVEGFLPVFRISGNPEQIEREIIPVTGWLGLFGWWENGQ